MLIKYVNKPVYYCTASRFVPSKDSSTALVRGLRFVSTISSDDFGVNVATLYFNRTLCKERFLEIEYRGASTYAQAQPMLDAFLQHLGGSDFPNLAFVPFPELKPATGAPETTDRDRLGLQYVRLFDVIDKSSSQ